MNSVWLADSKTLFSALAGISNSGAAAHTSKYFYLASRGYFNFNLEVSSIVSTGTTDLLVVDVLATIDRTNYRLIERYQYLYTQGSDIIRVRDVPFWRGKIRVASSGATDTFTATVAIQRYWHTEGYRQVREEDDEV
jgi:hypothetical protein